MLENGTLIDRDFKSAANLYAAAALQGNGYALFELAGMTANGHGVKKDPALAIELYRQATKLGVTLAVKEIYNLCNQPKVPDGCKT